MILLHTDTNTDQVQSYFHRTIFTILYIVAAIWPTTYGTAFVKAYLPLITAWVAGCLILSTFTLLPVVKVESANLITAGGILMFGTGFAYLMFEMQILSRSRSTSASTKSTTALSRTIMGLQLGVIVLTIFITRSSIASLQAKKGLPLGNQLVGWLCLLSSLALPFVHRLAPNSYYLHRLVLIFLAFSPTFILLTISYEGLFYFAFCTTLVAWVRLEQAVFIHTTSTTSPLITDRPPTSTTVTSTSPPKTLLNTDSAPSISTHTTRTLTLPDLRTSLFFLHLVQSAFFSTGNIASISSFSLDAVYRLLPIFDPFSQGALLLFKILVPFAVLSATTGILNRMLRLESSALFMVVMGIGDVMTIRFFWMVRDEGSWLDIGTSISHFVIGSLLCVFVAGLEGVGVGLVRGVDVDGETVGDVKVTNGMLSRDAMTNGSAANGAIRGVVDGVDSGVRREARQVID